MSDVSLRERRQALLDQADLQGYAFCKAYAVEADAWLSHLAEQATDGNQKKLALLAVGGYGRASLCPYSDLDVVLVHEGRRDISTVADAIWYPVWDEGVHLDHSVRRPREVLEAAGEDLRVALGLLDARLVWGDAKVAEPLLAQARERWTTTYGARWLPALQEQMAERRRSHGDVAFLLEPELKESHGGLRDVNVLEAMSSYAPLLADYVRLSSLVPAAELLTNVRVELHRSAGRELDRLLLEDQDHVAASLGYADADVLMGALATAGRTIAWVSDDAWRRRRLWEPDSSRRGRRRRSEWAGDAKVEEKEMEPGIIVVGGEVALTPAAPVQDDPALALRLASVAAELDLPIARGSLHRLADKMAPPPEPWPVEVRQALVRLLATGHAAIDPLEALDQEGLFVRILPEWQAVRNKPQRNAYHRFTVDRHLLETAANAADLADRVDRPDLLLLGALLHDIGKGFPGDHTVVGIELMEVIGARMGFPPADVHTLQEMVRHHLLLPDAATRRDLDDPSTIEHVAEAVENRRTLELLAALTEADSLATGSSAWGPWKAGLVADLTVRTARYLDGEEAPKSGWITDLHRKMVEEVKETGRPAVMLDPPRVVVAANDRRGLLASVAGTLALHGLDVRSADATGDIGTAVEVFTVEVGRGTWPDSTRLREDLQTALVEKIDLDHRLAEKARAYAGARRPSSARKIVPQVSVDNDASATSTVVEVRALDELGLLHRVSQALFECELDVVSARVSTIGVEVVDAFYVRSADGQKVTDPTALDAVTGSLRQAIGDATG